VCDDDVQWFNLHLTSLAVIPSVTRGRAKMQKPVTPSLTLSTDSETDGHAMVITVALRCRYADHSRLRIN